MMATEKKEGGGNVNFSCTICLEPIVKPRWLPCAHTFCEECLQTFISRAAIGKKEDNFKFKCPVCRRLTGCPEQGIPMEEWAKHISANTFPSSLTTSMEKQPQDNLCAICLRDDKQVKAESWCNECQEMICETCKGLHKIVVTLQKHKITALELKNQTRNLRCQDRKEPCSIHAGKVVEVFCLDHRKMCCSICFPNEHGCCEHVEAYENVVKRIQKYNLEGDIEVLSKEAKVVKEMIKHKEQTIRETDARKETILTNVSTEIEKLKSKLDECQQQFKKTFLKTHEKNKDKLKQCVQDLKQYLVTVQNGQALLSAVQQQGSEKHAFLAALKTITDVEEKFNYFQQNYLKDEQIQYEHDHTTILWQVCNHLKILDVTLVPSPSMIMWNLSLHLPSFEIHEQKQPSTLLQNRSKFTENREKVRVSGNTTTGHFC